jgi:amino-acid N-acetyltransferase
VDTSGYARWFRASTPYISAHRNRTFVVLLGGEAIAHANLANIVHDLALLHVLGVRLVLVHGARPQIDAACPDSRFHGHRRITDRDSMDVRARRLRPGAREARGPISPPGCPPARCATPTSPR